MAKKSARQSPTVEEVIEEVNNVLDSHHSRLSDALVNSLEKFSEKMFEKNLIPEPVKNTGVTKTRNGTERNGTSEINQYFTEHIAVLDVWLIQCVLHAERVTLCFGSSNSFNDN